MGVDAIFVPLFGVHDYLSYFQWPGAVSRKFQCQ